MDLHQYLKALAKYWWAILVPAVLGATIGVFTISNAEPLYQGSVTFFVRTNGEGTANGQFAGDQFAQRRVNSYVALLSSDRLANMIVESTDLELTAKQVGGMIGATGDINTVLLTATVTSTSEAQAEAVVESIAVQFVKLVNEVEYTPGVGAAVNLDVVSGPTVDQVASRPLVSIAIPAILGSLAGLGIALLLELRDTSVRSDEQLNLIGAGPLLGRIPFDRSAEDAPLVVKDHAQGIRAEALRQLRTNLQFINIEQPVQALVVTSSVAGEGKTTTAANLALVMASANRRVLVIEADFRRPQIADHFGIDRTVGLTDVLAGQVAIEHVLQSWDHNLVVLPCGHLPPNPSELLGSEAMARLLERFRHEFDAIIIDAPPLLPVTDAAVIATRADGVLLTIRFGHTTRHQVSLAVRSLEAVGATMLGSVLTMVPARERSVYGTYGTYGSGTHQGA